MPEAPRTVLVTGAAGYIGSHVVVALLEAGDRVVAIDNHDNSSPESLVRARELAGLDADDPRLLVEVVDVRDLPALRATFASAVERGTPIDAVVHLAGRKAVGESVAHPMRYWDHNVRGSLALVEAMAEAGVGDLVFSSSCTVYGEPEQVPIDEDEPVAPINPYGHSKAVVEQVLRSVADDGSMDRPDGGAWRVLLLRYFNPVGAHPSGRIGEDPTGVPDNLMPFVMQVAVGRRPQLAVFGDDYDTPDGTCIRDYLHVVDLAEAHVAALDALGRVSGCAAVNIGTGRGSSVLEVVAAAERAVGRPIPRRIVGRRAGDAPQAWADPTLAGELLGWRATRDLDDMCRDHWRWQQDNPQGYAAARGAGS